MDNQKRRVEWPVGSDSWRTQLLTAPGPGRRRVVIDTDTYNEVDDQFALVHALLAEDALEVEAIYAAPFHNDRSSGPGDGMRKSFEEIGRLLELLGRSTTPVLEGAQEWIKDSATLQSSPAVGDLIQRAMSPSDRLLYVVAIGAPTNISTAICVAPEIINRIVVVWLGGNSLHWPTAREFNLRQDIEASRVLFDSGVALVRVPCLNVADHLITTRAEMERFVLPAGPLGQFLTDRYVEYVGDRVGASKVIWDLAAVAWVLEPSWTTTNIVHSPILTEEMTWSRDPGRHLVAEMTDLSRDAIFGDLFLRLANRTASAGSGPRKN
jgi:purine nucleosidase